MISLISFPRKVFEVNDTLYVGLTGLATDVISIDQLLKFRCNLYSLRENREIKPETFSALLSTILYEKRQEPTLDLCCEFTHRS